jgi:hypothetical protein
MLVGAARNQDRLDRFASTTSPHGNLACVWNCPSLDEVVPETQVERIDIDPDSHTFTGDVWLLFHGSVVPARLPEAVLYALVTLPNHVKVTWAMCAAFGR